MECAACHKEVSPDSYFCTWCSKFVPSPEQGSKANLFARWVGWVIDPLIAIVLYFLSVMTIGVIFPPLAILVAILLPIAYFIWFLSLLRTGRTPGKLLMGLQVVNYQTGSIPGFGKMFLREIIGRILSGAFFFGYLWALIDKNGQAFHDKLAGTVVLKVSRTAAAQAGAGRKSRVPAGGGVDVGAETSSSASQSTLVRGRQPMWAMGAILLIVVGAGAVLLLRGLNLGPLGGATAGASLNGPWHWEAGEEGTANWVLSQNGRKLAGQYSWDLDPRRTEVRGEISPAGVITLREARPRAGTERARYEGRLQPDGAIVGEQIFEKWRNPWRLERAPGDAPKVQFGGASDPGLQQQTAPSASQHQPPPGAVETARPAPGDVSAPTAHSNRADVLVGEKVLDRDSTATEQVATGKSTTRESRARDEAEAASLRAQQNLVEAEAARQRQEQMEPVRRLLVGHWYFDKSPATIRANQVKAVDSYVDFETVASDGSVSGAIVQPNNPEVPRMEFRGTIDGETVTIILNLGESVTRKWIAKIDVDSRTMAGPVANTRGGMWSNNWSATKR